jgi:hypothetical protein
MGSNVSVIPSNKAFDVDRPRCRLGVGTTNSGADSEGTDGSPSVHPDP